jgi:hypothetical protein
MNRGNGETAEILDRLPPEALSMERNFLGCCLLDGAIAGQCDLTPHDFRDDRNRLIYSTLRDLAGEGLAADVEILTHRLREQGKLDDAGGTGYLAELLNSVAVAAHWPTYARPIKDCAARRRIIQVSTEALQGVWDPRRSVASILETMRGAADREGERSGASRFEVGSMSMTELDGDNTEATFIIKNMVVEGEPGAVGAARKGMKTSISIDEGVSISTGLPFLGAFPVLAPRRVLYLNGEGSRPFLRGLLRRVCRSKGISLADVTGLRIGKRFPRLDNPEHLAAIRRECEACEAEVLFYDCLYLGMSGDNASNVFSQGERFQMVGELCEQCGVTLIVLHHTTRRQQHEGAGKAPELVDLSWAGLAEFASQWQMIGKREPYDPSNPGSHRLVLEIGGRQGQSGAWAVDIEEGDLEHGRRWDVNVAPITEARTAEQNSREEARLSKAEEKRGERIDADKRKILAVAVRYPNGKSKTFFRDTAGLHSTRFAPAFAELVEAGDMVPCEIVEGNRKSPIEGYRIATDE